MDFIKNFFIDMGVQGIVGQAVGFVAMIILVSSFQKNTQKKIVTFQMIAESLWAVHYLLLGVYAGMAMNLVGASRGYVYANRETKKWADKKYIPYLFLFISIAAGMTSWASLISVLPIFAVGIASFVLWSKKPWIIRVFSIPICVCWLIFNVDSGSYAGVVTELFNLISISAGIIRYDIRNMKKQSVDCNAQGVA